MEGSPPTRRAHCPLHPSPSPGCPGSPLGVGQPSPPSLAGWGTMCPLRSFPLGGGRDPLFLHSPLPPQLSPSPVGQRPSPPGKPPACGRPAAASFRRIGVPTLGGCSATLGPPPIPLLSHCQRAPTPAPTPFTAEPGASLGSRRNRLQNARAWSPFPPPAAQTPALWLG